MSYINNKLRLNLIKGALQPEYFQNPKSADFKEIIDDLKYFGMDINAISKTTGASTSALYKYHTGIKTNVPSYETGRRLLLLHSYLKQYKHERTYLAAAIFNLKQQNDIF